MFDTYIGTTSRLHVLSFVSIPFGTFLAQKFISLAHSKRIFLLQVRILYIIGEKTYFEIFLPLILVGTDISCPQIENYQFHKKV